MNLDGALTGQILPYLIMQNEVVYFDLSCIHKFIHI